MSDLSAAVPDGVTVDAATWTACIDALVALLTTIVDAGKIEDRRGAVHLLSDASPWLTIGRLIRLMQHVERAVLDESRFTIVSVPPPNAGPSWRIRSEAPCWR